MSRSDGKTVSLRYGQLYLDDIKSISPAGIEMEKNDCHIKIQEAREKLAMLIAGNPKDLMSKYDIEEGDPKTWISENIDEIEEELAEQYRKLERLEILDTIFYEWEHGKLTNSWENMTPDLDLTYDESLKFVFPQDKKDNEQEHYDIMFGKKKLDDHSFNEMYDKCKVNLNAEDFRREIIEDGVCVVVDDKLFITYLGQWVFPNEDEAFRAVKDKLNIPLTDYINKQFIKEHNDFFAIAASWANEEDAATIFKYVADIDSIDGRNNMGLMTEFYDALSRSIDKFLKSHMKFYTMKYQLALGQPINK